MKIELVDQQNYNKLTKWWEGYSWPSIPYEMLPKIGFIANDCVAGFIYSTDSKICVIEWIIGDPTADKDKRKESLNLLLDQLCSTAKKMGYNFCFTYTKNSGLITTLEQNNFKKTDENMIHFIRGL